MKLTADTVNRMAGEKAGELPCKKGSSVFFTGKTGFYLWREGDVICAKKVRGFGRTQRFCTNAAGAAERPAPKNKKRILCTVLLLFAVCAALLFAGSLLGEACTVGRIGGADGPTKIFVTSCPSAAAAVPAAVLSAVCVILFLRRKTKR